MKNKLKNFGFTSNKKIPIDEFMEKALYKPRVGYYNNRFPFGKDGDFITSPTISNLFSEILAVWIVSVWEKFERPKIFNLVELGPGDGSLTKILIQTFKKFPEFNKSVKIFLYEKSDLLINIQKKKIEKNQIKWIKNYNSIKKGPVIFLGNEFFDAIPIKQFTVNNKKFLEKCYLINEKGMIETYKKPLPSDVEFVRSFDVLKNQNFIEYPKLGFYELNKIIKKISALSGGILLIDYGYLKPFNGNTLQTVMENKKIQMSNFSNHIGKADVTYLVNFSLLKEFFKKKNLKVKKIVTQKFFLETMGIIERAKIIEKKMNNRQKKNMLITLKRLLHKDSMGELFKVIFSYNSKENDFLGFD
tara:strand:- start:240 stop:1316 length:1077 start_codon:yes stop_codon:yes gene_type:complete